MKIAVIANHNSYAAREYIPALLALNIRFDVLSIGTHPDISPAENERCDNLWQPLPFSEFENKTPFYSFDSLKSPEFLSFLENTNYDLGIQGGTGILKPIHFNAFRLGILNFHPGDLPAYQGCSAPEWQIYENKPVVSTCHIVDSGIDTGPIYKKKTLATSNDSYAAMRASIYPQTALFVAETIQEIIDNNGFKEPPQKQDASQAIYREYIGNEKIAFLKENFKTLLEACPTH